MRNLAILCLSVAALPLSGCMTGRSDGSPQIQTAGEANRENVQGAVSAPLRDLNVLRTKIPPVLLAAMADPYARPANTQCDTLTTLITPLNDAMGADLDSPSVDEDDLLERGREGALGAMATVASSTIPFRGWVRQLTGAEQHDRIVQAAITAGAVRRAYLKGLGESRGCNPPATPSHELDGSPVLKMEGGFKPRYPIRRDDVPETPSQTPPGAAPR